MISDSFGCDEIGLAAKDAVVDERRPPADQSCRVPHDTGSGPESSSEATRRLARTAVETISQFELNHRTDDSRRGNWTKSPHHSGTNQTSGDENDRRKNRRPFLRSAATVNRLSFWRHRRSTSRPLPGTSCGRALQSGSPLITAASVSATVSPLNARLPVRDS